MLTKNGKKRSASNIAVWSLAACILISGCSATGRGIEGYNSSVSPDKVEARVLTRTSTSWDGALLPEYPAGRAEITVLHITIPPGAKLPLHRHPLINVGFLISGELTVITEHGARLNLKAGESIVEVVDTWHYGQNEGSVPAEIVVFYAGASGLDVTEYPVTDSTS